MQLTLGLCDTAVSGPGLWQPAPVPSAHPCSPRACKRCLLQPESPCSWLSPPLGMLFLLIFPTSCHSGQSPEITFSVRPAPPIPAKEASPVPSNARHPVSFSPERSSLCSFLVLFVCSVSSSLDGKLQEQSPSLSCLCCMIRARICHGLGRSLINICEVVGWVGRWVDRWMDRWVNWWLDG